MFDEGEGDHNGSNYLMIDKIRPNWIDGLDEQLNQINRLRGVPCKNRAVYNQNSQV